MVFHAKEGNLLRGAFAIAVVAVAYTAVSGVARAASIAPLPAVVRADVGNVTPVYYYHRRYYPYRWHGHYYHHRYHRYGRYHYY
jgi:hypothetical protein